MNVRRGPHVKDSTVRQGQGSPHADERRAVDQQPPLACWGIMSRVAKRCAAFVTPGTYRHSMLLRHLMIACIFRDKINFQEANFPGQSAGHFKIQEGYSVIFVHNLK